MNNDEANKKERNYPCRRGYNILNEQILLIFSQEHENYFRSEIPKFVYEKECRYVDRQILGTMR